MKKYCRNCKYYKSYYSWDIFCIFWKPVTCFPCDEEGLKHVTPWYDCEEHNKDNDCIDYKKKWWRFWVK